MQTQLQLSSPKTLTEYLDSISMPYELNEIAEDRFSHTLIRAVLFEDELGKVMAILPDDYFLDYNLFCKNLDRNLIPFNEQQYQEQITKTGLMACFPLPEAFGVQGLIDESIMQLEMIHIYDEATNSLFAIKPSDYIQFLTHCATMNFAIPAQDLLSAHLPDQKIPDLIKQLTPARIKQRVKETFELPAIPVVASRILKLRLDPNATVEQLTQIVQTDPSLAAQLMNWARSAYYGYKGLIDSLDVAIVNVLGFEVVMELSLGIALSRAMRVPIEGPLGLRKYWAFTIHTAVLVEKIAAKILVGQKPARGLAYLAGLLHNFGHLILGQLFPPHFDLLNRYIEVNPQVSILEIEHYVLGVGHDQMGAWMLETWNLPPEIVDAARYHHQIDFTSQYAIYPTLVYIAIYLLKRNHLGDSNTQTLPQSILDKIGLHRDQLEEVYAQVMSKQDQIQTMTNELLAIAAK